MKRILIHRSTSSIGSKSISPQNLPPGVHLQKSKSNPSPKKSKPLILEFKVPSVDLQGKTIKKRRHKKRAKKRKRKVHEIP